MATGFSLVYLFSVSTLCHVGSSLIGFLILLFQLLVLYLPADGVDPPFYVLDGITSLFLNIGYHILYRIFLLQKGG